MSRPASIVVNQASLQSWLSGIALAIMLSSISASDTVIRPARPEDASRLDELHTASVRALCSGHYSADVIEGWLWNRASSGYLGAIERGRLFVAERGGRIVGFGKAAPGTVIVVYVDPTNVLQGIGTVILRHVLALARREHNGPVRLEATLNARDFYKRTGKRKGDILNFRPNLLTSDQRGISAPLIVI